MIVDVFDDCSICHHFSYRATSRYEQPRTMIIYFRDFKPFSTSNASLNFTTKITDMRKYSGHVRTLRRKTRYEFLTALFLFKFLARHYHFYFATGYIYASTLRSAPVASGER